MQCPGCRADALGVRQRLLVAVRAEARCPACGVAIRFGFWPRTVHLLLGEVVLVAGFAAAFVWQAPALLVLAGSSWLGLALVLPLQSAPHPGPSRSPPPSS